MAVLLRLVRVTAATVLCIVVFAALFEFFNVALHFIFPPEYIRDVGAFRRKQPLFGALLLGGFFHGPRLLYFGTIPILLVLGICEWRSQRKWVVYLVIWVAAGLLAPAAGLLATRMESVVGILISAAAANYLYWVLAGRSAGILPDTPELRGRNGKFRVLNYAAYAVLAYLAFQLVGYGYYGTKLLWVSYVTEPGLGTPPFQKMQNRKLSAAQKVALMDFPDVASCLKKPKTGGSVDLKEMDWDKIDNKEEAEVCTFRLLASYEDLSPATEWFEAQGFRVPENFSSARPYAGRSGTLRVSASHSIRSNGPKFPTRGVVRRAFQYLAYSMSIDATWSSDGKRLLGVNITFTYL